MGPEWGGALLGSTEPEGAEIPAGLLTVSGALQTLPPKVREPPEQLPSQSRCQGAQFTEAEVVLLPQAELADATTPGARCTLLRAARGRAGPQAGDVALNTRARPGSRAAAVGGDQGKETGIC